MSSSRSREIKGGRTGLKMIEGMPFLILVIIFSEHHYLK